MSRHEGTKLWNVEVDGVGTATMRDRGLKGLAVTMDYMAPEGDGRFLCEDWGEVPKLRARAQMCEALATQLWAVGCCTPGTADRLLGKEMDEADHALSCALVAFLEISEVTSWTQP